jgi:uncharacterized membrane protein YsdA (DUF1294 family)/cold shock CspA family protein
MRYVGRLTDWNDAKGYGFVEPHGGGDRAFVHIKAFERVSKRPANGALISYELQRSDGRFNARNIRFADSKPRVEPAAAMVLPRKTIACVFAIAIGIAWWLAKIPLYVVGIYAAMSLIAFAFYWRDKAAARTGQWRTPESTLHLVAALGGWPGALVAQDVLRHKLRKSAFQLAFWATVLINCAAMAWLVNLRVTSVPG